MSTEPEMDLSLMLQPPPGEKVQQLHERRLEDIPRSVAEEIVQDFVSQGPRSETERYQMYRIGDGPDGRLVALDFGEVSGVLVG